MPFTPEAEFPDFSRILNSLNEAGISVKNPALYQAIKQLIDKVLQFKDLNQTQVENILADITDLSNVVNNIITGNTVQLPPPWMPTFDGEDGIDGFSIPGRDGTAGRDGLDGKVIPNLDDCCGDSSGSDAGIPFGLITAVSAESASEFTTTSTGNVDDLDFGNARLIRFNNATLATLRGLKAGIPGQKVTIVSIGAGDVYLANQDAGSTAANRLINSVTSGITPLAAGSGASDFQYDGTTGRWRLINHKQGAWLSVAFNAGDFSTSGGGAITFPAGAANVPVYKYFLNGKTLSIALTMNGFSIAAVVGTLIRVLIPNSWTAATQVENPGRSGNNAALGTTQGIMVTVPTTDATKLFLTVNLLSTVNWAVSAANSAFSASLPFDIN